MDIALVNPQTENSLMREGYGFHENLAIGLIAAFLQSHHYHVVQYDLRIHKMTEKEASHTICNSNFEVVAFSINYATFQSAITMAQLIKIYRPNTVIIFGGEHVSYLDEEIIMKYSFVDYIVRGEGEYTFLELIQAMENKKPLTQVKGLTYREMDRMIKTENRAPIQDLDSLPFASKEIVKHSLEAGLPIEIGMLAQRGCPFKCSFCNGYKFLSNELQHCNTRVRTPQNVVEEMLQLQPLFEKNHNLILHFYDATFITKSAKNREWIEQFCDLIIEKNIRIPFDAFIRSDSFDFTKDIEVIEKLKRAGLIGTYIGLEAGDDEVLEIYNKNVLANDSMYTITKLREFGIEGSTNGVICFHQTVSLREVRNTLSFLYSIGYCSLWNLASKAETLPGIELEKQMCLKPRKSLWDVENYEFVDKKTEQVYQIIQHIKTNYFVANFEDGYIRRLRESAKLKIFYSKDIQNSIKLRCQLEADIKNMQSITYQFLNKILEDLETSEWISIESYNSDIKDYVDKILQELIKIHNKYLERLSINSYKSIILENKFKISNVK